MARNESAFMFSAFQKELLSRMIKGKESTVRRFEYEIVEKKKPVYILDGVCAVIFWDRLETFINYPFDCPIGNFNKLIESVQDKDYMRVFPSGEKRLYEKDIYTVLSCELFKIYVNDKYLKYFNQDIFTFHAYDEKGIILVKYYDDIVGVLMPRYFKD